MFQHTRQPKKETQCMTKQQAPHSQERCAGVPGHKKDAAAREGTHYPNPSPCRAAPKA